MSTPDSTWDTAFWAKVDNSGGMYACWPWTGVLWKGYSYGHLERNKHKIKAHRYAWEQAFGPIPVGLLVCHHCDNPPCVNPGHLFLGTQKANLADMIAKGRSARGDRSGARRHPELMGHRRKLTEVAVREIRRRYALGGVRQRDLGAEFGVTQTMIGDVVRRDAWKQVE